MQETRTVNLPFLSKQINYLVKPIAIPQVIVLVTLICLPLLFSYSFIEPVVSLRMLFLSIGTIGLSIATYFTTNNTFYFSKLFLMQLAVQVLFAFWILYSGTYALNQQASLYEFGRYLLVTAFAINIYVLIINDVTFFNKICVALVISIFLQSIFTVFLYYHIALLNVPHIKFQASGVFVNRTIYSSYVAICFPCGYYLFVKSQKAEKNIIAGLLLFVAYALLLAQTRAAFISVFFTSAVFIVYLFMFKKEWRKKIVLFAAVALIGFILLTIVVLVLNPNLKKNVATKVHPQELSGGKGLDTTELSSSNIRLTTWKKTWTMCKENLLKGVGFGNWRVHIENYGTEKTIWAEGDIEPDRVHNIYLEMLAELGIIGLSFFIITFTLSLFYFLFRKKEIQQNSNSIAIVTVVCMVLSFLLDGLLSFTYRNIDHLLLFYSAIAIFWALLQKNNNVKKVNKLIVTIALICFSVYAFFAAKGTLSFLQATQKINTKILSGKSADALPIIEKYEPSIFANMTEEGRPFEVFSSVAYYNLGYYDKAIAEAKKIFTQNPNNHNAWMNLGYFYLETKQLDSAKKYALGAYKLKNDFDKVILELATIYQKLGKCDSAVYLINKMEINNIDPAHQVLVDCGVIK